MSRRTVGECDDLSKMLVMGILDIAEGFDKGKRDLMEEGVVKVILAARDIASRGELRGIEAEMNELLGFVGNDLGGGN